MPDSILQRKRHGKVGPDPQYVVSETGCWEWQWARDNHGYGRIRVDGRVTGAYRVYYEAYKGPIPEGLEIDHLCRNPSCVNPEHLEAVTHAENCRRGTAAATTSAKFAQPRLCPQGHPMWGDNLYVYRVKDGTVNRMCRICRRETSRRSKERGRALRNAPKK